MKRSAIEVGEKSRARGSTFAKARSRLKPGRRRRKVRIPKDVRARVFARSRWICVRPGCGRRCVHTHHWLDEAKFPELALEEDNLSGTCPHCNWNHHNASPRLPFEAIPACTLRLTRAADAGRRMAHLERYYPTLQEAAA